MAVLLCCMVPCVAHGFVISKFKGCESHKLSTMFRGLRLQRNPVAIMAEEAWTQIPGREASPEQSSLDDAALQVQDRSMVIAVPPT